MTNISAAPTVPSRGRGFAGRLVVGILLLLVIVAGIWFERAPLLRGAADLWIVSDPLTPADVVAVLGGGLNERPFAAAALYKAGLANKIIVSQAVQERYTKLGLPGHTELNHLVLLKLGVPEAAIGTFGKENASTDDEAVALRAWTAEHHVSRIIIPTEIFFSRRARWIFNREFVGSAVYLQIAAFEPSKYTRAEWWKSNGGIIDFQNEFLKYLYYRIKY
jgi:uncharacterized SAM-binding protein YcdF (DUF218 family)